MSLLIKGVEMPDIENNKSIKAEIRNLDGKLELGIMTGGYYCSQQWTYYPIVSVPTPHGSLKDADAAIMLLQKYYDRVGEPLKEHAIGECIMIIKDDVPTIIEVEE